MLFILDHWYLWVIGLIILPVLAVLPQIKNILQVLDRKDREPKEIVRLFLNPGTLAVSIMSAMGAFVCLVFFFLSAIFAVIRYIKA